MHFWRTAPLVEKLARDELTAEQRAQYLLAGLLVYVFATYSGLMAGGTVRWTPPYIAEALLYLAITTLGVVKAFDASGGSKNPRFIVDFTCLYVPVSVSTVVSVWTIYWVLRFGYDNYILALTESRFQLAINLSHLGMDVFVFLSFAAVLGVQVVTFARLVSLMAELRALRGDA